MAKRKTKRRAKPAYRPPNPKADSKKRVHIDETGFIGSQSLSDAIWPELASKQQTQVAAAFGTAALSTSVHRGSSAQKPTPSTASDIPLATPSGYINLMTGKVEHNPAGSPPGRVKPDSDPIIRCSRCGQRVPQSQMRTHLRDKHNMPTSKEKQEPKAASRRTAPHTMQVKEDMLVQCPYCPNKVRMSNRDRHMAKVHPAMAALEKQRPGEAASQIALAVTQALAKKAEPSAAPIPPQAKPSVSQDPAKLVTCPTCGVAVRGDRLSGHMRKVHGRPPTTLQTQAFVAHPPQSVKQAKQKLSGNSHTEALRGKTYDEIFEAILRVLDDRARRNPGPWQVMCPYCRQALKSQADARNHVARYHRADIESRYSVRANQSGQSSRSHVAQVTSGSYGTSKRTEWLREESYDPIDGGKYLGYMQRERSGRFGSLPLYDGYDDEDFA